MTTSRRVFAALCWLLAAATVVFATMVGVSITQEYGISPNHNLPMDLANGLITLVAPAALVGGGLVWAGRKLWHRS